MKKVIFKPLALLAIGTMTLFGCASTDYSAANTDIEPTADVEVDVDDNESVANTEIEIDADVEDVEMDANIEYEDMFEDIADTKQYNVLALARLDPNLSTFVRLVEQSGLAASFEVAGPITVFAPTNDSFERMPEEEFAMLLDAENADELREILQRHVISSEIVASELGSQQVIQRAEGDNIRVESENFGRVITVGGAAVIKPDIEVQNGVLHVVSGIVESVNTPGIDMR